MRGCFGVLITLVSAQLLACGLGGEEECETKGTGVTSVAGVFSLEPGLPDYAVAGKPSGYPFTYPIQQTCDDTVTARLERADGTEVPAEWSVQRVERTKGRLELTPSESGAFQLKLTFEPGARQATLNILVAEDRSETAYEEIPRWCTVVLRTAAGALLCDQRVYRGGVQEMELPVQTRLAASGNVVWEWEFSRGTLHRFIDDGSVALREDPLIPLDVPCCAGPDQLVSSEDDVLVVGTDLSRYESTPTGITQRGSAEYGEASGNTKYFIGSELLLRKEHLAFVVFQQRERSEACVYSLAKGQVTLVPWNGPVSHQHRGCQILEGTHVGASDGGVWVHGRDTSTSDYRLRFYTAVGEGLVEAASLDLPDKLQVIPASGVNPGPPELRLEKGNGERILPRYVDGQARFELYSPAPGYEFRDSHEGLVTFITSQGPGSTRVYRR